MENSPNIIVCMDEGCIMPKPILAVAGSGCLCDAKNMEERATKLARAYINYARKNKIKKLIITTHEGCGAGGLAHQRDNAGETAPSAVTDQEVMDLMRLVKEKINGQIDVELKHLTADKMCRPKGQHNATAVVWDARPDKYFNPKFAENFPQSFLIHEFNDESGRSITNPFIQIATACNIAFGEQSINNFSKEKPFTIIIIGSQEKKQALEEFLKAKPVIQANINRGLICIITRKM